MYFIYKHKDTNDKVFYIGKGTKNFQEKSQKEQYARAYNKGKRSKKWYESSINGYSVEIIEENEDENYILSKELLLVSECEDCINTTTQYTSLEYEIIKLNENVAIFKIGGSYSDNQYILLREGKMFSSAGREYIGSDNGNGYLIAGISFKRDGKFKKKNFYLHRLIAEAFIPNPENKKVVNHKDGNKLNIHADNLEWNTIKENVNHAIRTGLNDFDSRKKSILQFDTFGNFIKEWKIIDNISSFYNCTNELIQSAMSFNNNNSFSAKDYLWVYKEDYDNSKLEKFNKSLAYFKEKENKTK